MTKEAPITGATVEEKKKVNGWIVTQVHVTLCCYVNACDLSFGKGAKCVCFNVSRQRSVHEVLLYRRSYKHNFEQPKGTWNQAASWPEWRISLGTRLLYKLAKFAGDLRAYQLKERGKGHTRAREGRAAVSPDNRSTPEVVAGIFEARVLMSSRMYTSVTHNTRAANRLRKHHAHISELHTPLGL